MLLNTIKLSFRLMLRAPFYTLINIAGLSIGFTAFYILWPYSQNELNSDRFHRDYEHIAKLSRQVDFVENGISASVKLPAHNSGIARQFRRDYPEIVDMTSFIPQLLFETYRQGFDKDLFIAVEKESGHREYFREYALAFVDSNFFQFFSYPLYIGDPAHVLLQPGSAVVSESHARKYFGNSDPVNKVIYLNDSIPVTVTGVFRDFPENTHLRADVLISTAGIEGMNLTSWEKNWFGNFYIRVTPGTDFGELQNKINKDKVKIYGNCPRCTEGTTSVYIQPLETIVFDVISDNLGTIKSKYLLIALSGLAIIIPLLAWINYLSLSTHMLHKRISEMGVRKVVGAGRRHFVLQFVVESALLNLIAILVSVTLVQLLKGPVEVWLTFYSIPWQELPASTVWIGLSLIVLGIFLSSAYPVVIAFRNKSMLFMKKTWSYRNPGWISLMVTAQYSMAIILLISVVCVYLQMRLILSKPLGIDKDGVIAIDCPLQQQEGFDNKLDAFITRLVQQEGIMDATVSKNIAGDWPGYGVPLQRHKEEIEYGLDVNGGVDEHFIDVYKIKLLHGRNFQSDMPSDRNAILISRGAAQRLGFPTPEAALGARLIMPWYGHDDVEVIGIYEDYEFRPFFALTNFGRRGSFLAYKKYLMPDYYPSKISVRVNYGQFQAGLAQVKELFNEVFPHDTFHWRFIDENIQNYYASEKVARNQIGAFTLVAILVACLGLLGLVTNKVAEKTKEIGIRKVLGADLTHIVGLLLKSTLRHMGVAAALGIPVAYYMAGIYIERFSERIELQWWIFAAPLVTLVVLMSATIASVVWRAARSNPVEALKSE